MAFGTINCCPKLNNLQACSWGLMKGCGSEINSGESVFERSAPSVWGAETTFRELHDEVSRPLVVAVRFHNIAIDLVMETKVGGRDSNGRNHPKPSNTVN